jgi:hypothetical protein
VQGKKAELNKEQVLDLASKFWRPAEIGAFFGVSERTVYAYVTAEELAAARERGKGELRNIALDRAKKDSRVLLYLLTYHLGEIPQTRQQLSECSNSELAEEVSRRIAASKAVDRLITAGDLKRAMSVESALLPSSLDAAAAFKEAAEAQQEPRQAPPRVNPLSSPDGRSEQ